MPSIDRRADSGFRRAHDRDRRALLATIRHELRTPLTSISGYLETLLDGEELDAVTTRRFLETAREQALRLGRMVEGMLEFSLLDLSVDTAGWCDVVQEVRACIDAAVPLARERNVAIRVRVPRMLPARVDADACVHAVLNVIENAVKHGRERGTVAVRAARETPFIRIVVDDDGDGIPAHERDAVFTMGARGSAAVHGSGIGLAVVKAIVTRAGGDVCVDRSPLGGARFVLRFPEAFTPGAS